MLIKSYDFVKRYLACRPSDGRNRLKVPTIYDAGLIFCLFFIACAHQQKAPGEDPFAALQGYASQQRIVEQGCALVPTPLGSQAAFYFGYDRNKDYRTDPSTGLRTGVDLIEFKRILADGTWSWEPFLIFSDDDFNGEADRIFLDRDFDGELDRIYNIESNRLKMDDINFRQLPPWSKKNDPYFRQ
jgi:hypothetical protein